MVRLERRLWLLVLLILPWLAASEAHAASRRIVSIEAARRLPAGTVVTVAGVASTPSGVFESSFFDKGFAVQDGTGGIFVSLRTDLHVLPRTRVMVTGVLKSSSGLLVIAPSSVSAVTLRGLGARVAPLWVSTGSVSEETEGLIVSVVGRITAQGVIDDLPYGHKFSVNDGSGEVVIFINTQTGIDPSGLQAGDLVRVSGFSSQFDTHYEIDPRGPDDIARPAR